jgi:hypothetical protein
MMMRCTYHTLLFMLDFRKNYFSNNVFHWINVTFASTLLKVEICQKIIITEFEIFIVQVHVFSEIALDLDILFSFYLLKRSTVHV